MLQGTCRRIVVCDVHTWGVKYNEVLWKFMTRRIVYLCALIGMYLDEQCTTAKSTVREDV